MTQDTVEAVWPILFALVIVLLLYPAYSIFSIFAERKERKCQLQTKPGIKKLEANNLIFLEHEVFMYIDVNGKEAMRRCERRQGGARPFAGKRADMPVRVYTPVLHGREELVETMDGLRIIGEG